ncbi:hypothetical protein G9C98_000770 [Cotesia typhae]|uniref:Uncharacterized protein n=1 Tax=Cotesia typhae TaxID=2053667 RepID=A0A8J5UW53_9HYME|nr:hypothetical protein G9C98_000770 [Cotesia typhae]
MAIVRICNTTDPVDLRVLNDYLMNHNLNRLHVKSHHPLADDQQPSLHSIIHKKDVH